MYIAAGTRKHWAAGLNRWCVPEKAGGMITNQTDIRVRYGETDRMGFLHHGKYALYFEEGRTELLRSLGTTYREMEDAGLLLPVVSLSVEFVQPAHYDEVVTVTTWLRELPRSRLTFSYEATRPDGSLVARGQTVHAFLDGRTRKPRRPPQDFLALLQRHWV
jgi:acyl-CoA thioester hydrolase